MDRRQFLARSSLLALGAATAWEGASRLSAGDEIDPTFAAGPVRHILPAATHERLRVKVSLGERATRPPALTVDGAPVVGVQGGMTGRFWAFDVDGLDPATIYELRLHDASGEALTGSWPLTTMPGPADEPDRVRVLLYTCAGGPAYIPSPTMGSAYLSAGIKRRLLRRALQFAPDVVVANGDHVYWDLGGRNGWAVGNSPMARWRADLFDRSRRVLGTANERVLVRAFDPQIADLYRTLLRSVPVVFVQDDHDYTENDDLTDVGGTFPADPFMRDAAAATQHLYYPEFLPTDGLPSSFLREGDVSVHHGALRVGRLLEAVVYDCRAELTVGPGGRFLDQPTEDWLVDRLSRSPAAWAAQVPSAPFGWSAGKWLEWYPDTLGDDGQLHADHDKPAWSRGWLDQHDRLLAAASRRPDRTPLLLCGDIHATGAGRIVRSPGVDLAANPAVALLVGALGTGTGWPSYFRGTAARPSGVLEVEELLAPVERNGFTILEVTPGTVTADMFLWSPEDGPQAIDHLEPAHTFTFRRGGAG